jgi:ACT domain-containing protein
MSDDGQPAPAADDVEPDGGERLQSHTIRLELADEPGELLRALDPIAEYGGNLLSVFHERGNRTPRGRIPVEVDLECHPERFDDIVAALRDSGVTVSSAGAERYRDECSVLLVGHLVDTDLSDTLARIEGCDAASVTDVSLDAPEGTADVSSARLRLAVASGQATDAIAAVREVAAEKDLQVVEPLVEGGR